MPVSAMLQAKAAPEAPAPITSTLTGSIGMALFYSTPVPSHVPSCSPQVAVLDGEGEGWGGGAITKYAATHGQSLDACRGYGQPKGDTKAD